MLFRVGDTVVKYRAFSYSQYCAYGGQPNNVPLGTRGKIIRIPHNVEIVVDFINGYSWTVDPREIKLLDDKIELYKKHLREE
jgi:hypothetical protein